jgi:hypothetical protein
MVDNMYDIYMLDSECGKIRKFESSHFCFVKANMGPQEGSPYIMFRVCSEVWLRVLFK